MKKLLSIAFISVLVLLTGCAKSAPKVGHVSVTTIPITQTPASTNSNTTTNTSSSKNTLSKTMNTTKNQNFNQLAPPKKGDTIAILDTDDGTIKFKLFTNKVPEITKNFIELAKTNKYTNVPFHRIIKDFMIQTGDFEFGNGTGGYSYKGPGTKLNDEINPDLKHYQYTVSMANSGPNTNGSQFFIVSAKNGAHWLDGSYSIFGQVYEGMSVVDKIEQVKTDSNNKPLTPIKLKKVTIAIYK